MLTIERLLQHCDVRKLESVLRLPEPINMRVSYAFESRFSAGKI